MKLYNHTFSFLLLAMFLLICSCSSQQNKDNLPAGMWSQEPAQKWEDGLVSGNGTMGILVMGNPEKERIIFNHEECYEFLGTEEIAPPSLVEYIPKIKQLMLDGKYKEAAEYSIKKSGENWERSWTDPYHPAMEMNINQDVVGDLSNYSRKTNFETGEIEVSWTDDVGSFQRKSFVSRPDKVVVQKLSGNVPLSCRINITDLFKLKKANKKQVKGKLRLKKPILSVDSSWITYQVEYASYSRGYESGTKILVKGGEVSTVNNEIVVSNASEVLLLTRINFLEDFRNSKLNNIKADLDSLGDEYQALLDRHTKVHGEMFNRVKLDIYDGPKKSSEELIAGKKLLKDSIDPAFLETVFNMGRYTLISSSGELPPNLTGIWQGDFRPYWSGDFTLDANVNMQISGANLGNLNEAIDSYMNLLERIAPDWERNAKLFYGCDGYLSNIRTSGRRGLSNHYSVYGPWHFWTSGAQWLLLPAYEYYQTSGDEVFLKDRLLPMMKKTVQFYEGFLTTYDKNGKYIFVPSASPENTPNNSKGSCASINSTIDIAAAKEAITNLITVCKHLNIEQEQIPLWEDMLQKLPPYLISYKGAIKEWATPMIADNQAHRHISHLYPVWPGHEINQQDTPELFEAAKKSLSLRQIGDGSAFGMAHRALICSRLKMDDEVYNSMQYLLSHDYFYNSLFTAHNSDSEIYNADLINGFQTIIMEALVYSRPGFIELLPAWSPKIAKGEISGVRCRTNATVESLNWDFENMIVKAVVSSGKKQQLELFCKWGIENIKCSTGYLQKSPNAISIEVMKGESISVEFEMKPSILISPPETALIIDSTLQLDYMVLPTIENTALTFSSSNNTIAQVDENGRVKALKEGKVNILAESECGKKGKCELTVAKYIKPASVKFAKNGIECLYSGAQRILLLKANYYNELGAVVHTEGLKYTLRELGKGWETINEYIFYDKSTAGKESGKSSVKFPLRKIPSTADLAQGHFYILSVDLENNRRYMVSDKKIRVTIQ